MLSWPVLLIILQSVMLGIATPSSAFPSPAFGVGTKWFNADDDDERSSQLESIVYSALEKGYRHIDCAQIYNTYKSVSQGLHRFLTDNPKLSRENIFITDKIWNTHHDRHHVFEAVNRSLEELNTPYIDQLLIHYPLSWTIESDTNDVSSIHLADVELVETWNAMQELLHSGVVRNIGVSNFDRSQLEQILDLNAIAPATNQIECHPHLPQIELVEFCFEKGIEVSCYGPLIPLRAKELESVWNAAKAAEQIITVRTEDMNSKHDLTPAQVLLKYSIQNGHLPVTTTSKLERLDENLAVFSEEIDPLSVKEMDLLNFAELPYRLFNPKGWEGIQDKPLFNDAVGEYDALKAEL